MTDLTVHSSLEPAAAMPYLVLKTGYEGCVAHFYPALYQLLLISPEREEKIDLGFSGSRLLERLLQVPGEVVSREELMSHAWSDRVVGQGSLNQQIYTLRQILGDEKRRDIIQTLPRRGYLLNPQYQLDNRQSLTNDNTLTVEHSITAPKHQRVSQRLTWAVILLAVGLFYLVLLGYLYQSNKVPELHSQALNLKQIKVNVLAFEQKEAAKLMQLTRPLLEQLDQLATSTVHLVISERNGFIELLCQQPSSSLRTLMFPTEQIRSMPDHLLKNCLL